MEAQREVKAGRVLEVGGVRSEAEQRKDRLRERFSLRVGSSE